MLVLRSKRGSVLVELAVALPIFILLLIGIVEFGRVYYTHHMITNISREGARLAAIGEEDDTVKTNIINALNEANLDDNVINDTSVNPQSIISPSKDQRSRGDEVTVTIYYPVSLHIPFWTSSTYTVKGVTTMMVE